MQLHWLFDKVEYSEHVEHDVDVKHILQFCKLHSEIAMIGIRSVAVVPVVDVAVISKVAESRLAGIIPFRALV